MDPKLCIIVEPLRHMEEFPLREWRWCAYKLFYFVNIMFVFSEGFDVEVARNVLSILPKVIPVVKEKTIYFTAVF